MRNKRVLTRLWAALVIFAIALFVTSPCAAQRETVLHSLGKDGTGAQGGLTMDGAGNLYGVTASGGIHNNCPGGCGTAFELSPREGGGWTETVLHNFNGRDGAAPNGDLVLDSAGNLYGTTYLGGIHDGGTAFELSLREGGGWTEKVLHNFGGNDGFFPSAGLIMDGAGNLYGVTLEGGIHGLGTVFELSPRQDGGWAETVLRSFGSGIDGSLPYAGLILDSTGNLYGTTVDGGFHGGGTIFVLSPREDGGWTWTALHRFGIGSDGKSPYCALIFDAAGNLYGTTPGGGIHGAGTVFELSPSQGGAWSEKLLHSFDGNDGVNPLAGLIFDPNGNLYGTTKFGGIHGTGTAFRLSPRENGGWTETILHSFGRGTDGRYPATDLIFDSAGNLYGTTYFGGIHPCGGDGCGTVFEITP